MGRSRKAVAPVLATLLMIAVAVSMSVIIFMWSQGFLSQTSGAVGSQQGSQNQAAQSSVAIEAATGTASGTVSSGTIPHGNMTIFVRNVGAVAVNIASVSISGISSNTGFNKSVSVVLAVTSGKINSTSIPASLTTCAGSPGTACPTQNTIRGICTSSCYEFSQAALANGTNVKNRNLITLSSATSNSLAKGGSMTMTFTLPAIAPIAFPQQKGYVLRSGDTINIKVTTDVGTFAQTSLTVP